MIGEALLGGLDLGKRSDFAVHAVVGRRQLAQPMAKRKFRYQLRYLNRWELGTPYTALREGDESIIGDVKTRYEKPPLLNTPLAVDFTGVGMPVVEQMVAQRVRARLHPVLIVSGVTMKTPRETDDRSWHVPKVDLIGNMIILLEANLVHWQGPGKKGALPLITAFEKELSAFREFITRKKNTTYDTAGSEHDDIILAVALALWIGEHAGTGDVSGIVLPGEPEAAGLSAPDGVYHNAPAPPPIGPPPY